MVAELRSAALIPVILAGALSPQPEAAVRRSIALLSGVETAINGLSLAAQEEIGELICSPSRSPRMLAAGLWSPWEEATPANLNAFLDSWRAAPF